LDVQLSADLFVITIFFKFFSDKTYFDLKYCLAQNCDAHSLDIVVCLSSLLPEPLKDLLGVGNIPVFWYLFIF